MRRIKTLIALLAGFFLSATPVFAGTSVESNILFTGFKALMTSVTTALVIIAPVIAVVLTIYFAIRRSGADEMDQKMWGKRISNGWICAAVAVAGSGLVQLIMSYFGGSVT